MISPIKERMRAGSRWQHLPLILFSSALLSLWTGCLATPSYVITLHDGRVYRSAQAPLLDSKTGYYKFRDRYGRDVLLRDQEVSAIEEDPAQGPSKADTSSKKKPRKR